MNQLKANYEKVALAITVVVLMLCFYLGYSCGQKAEAFVNLNSSSPAGKSPGDILKENVNRALNTFTEPNSLPTVYDPTVPEREFYMLQSIPRFGKAGVNKPIDLIEKGSTQIHEGIDNSYWFENDLKEELKYDNALELDPDQDGFSIAEEHAAGTNPKDATSYPDLLAKVKAEKVLVINIELKVTALGGDRISLNLKAPGVQHEVESLNFNQRSPNRARFGTKLGKFKARYEYLAKDQAKGPNGINQPRYKIKDHLLNEEHYLFRRSSLKLEDLEVVLYLDALGKGADTGLTLQKGSMFALPFGGAEKKYKVKSLKKKGTEGKVYIAELEGPDGKTREIEVLGS